jgi:hypothetical protein
MAADPVRPGTWKPGAIGNLLAEAEGGGRNP